MNEEAYNYNRHQKEIIDSWQKHDYINKLNDNLRFVLIKINWTKSNYRALKKYHFANTVTYKKSFYKYIDEIDNIIRKLKLVNAIKEIKRAELIKNKTLNFIKIIKR